MLDDEAFACMGLKYDYSIDQCLKAYEADVGDELTLSADPKNLYYGRKQVKKTDEEEGEIELAEKADAIISYDFGSIKPEDYYFDKREGQSYDFDAADFHSFICDNTKMIFYSNPKGGLPKRAENKTLYEAKIDFVCNTFDLQNYENQLIAHFSMPDLSKSTLPDIYVNRTDEN
jgi:hypothetical protein